MPDDRPEDVTQYNINERKGSSKNRNAMWKSYYADSIFYKPPK